MNGKDFLQGGVDPELASKYVNFLKDRIDMFEISCGFSANAIMRPDTSKRKLALHTYDLTFTEGYTLSFAQIIKRKNPDAIIASVEGFRQARMMEDAIKDKVIDIISLSKPLIREPKFIKKIKSNPNTVSAFISCNHCLYTNGLNPKGLICDYP